MGLDVTAYEKAEVLPKDHQYDFDSEDVELVMAYAYVGLQQSTRGLVDHDVIDCDVIARRDYDVSGGESMAFRGGSYIYYNRFREALAQIGGYTQQPTITWPGRYLDYPFYELVYFADNEGCIGPEAAKDLAEDFRVMRDSFFAQHESRDFRSSYDEFAEGFELAAQHGLVEFH